MIPNLFIHFNSYSIVRTRSFNLARITPRQYLSEWNCMYDLFSSASLEACCQWFGTDKHLMHPSNICMLHHPSSNNPQLYMFPFSNPDDHRHRAAAIITLIIVTINVGVLMYTHVNDDAPKPRKPHSKTQAVRAKSNRPIVERRTWYHKVFRLCGDRNTVL